MLPHCIPAHLNTGSTSAGNSNPNCNQCAQTILSYTYPLDSVAMQSFIHLSELSQCGMNTITLASKLQQVVLKRRYAK